VLFESLYLAESGGVRQAGFVHIPALEASGESGVLSWEELRRGAAIILETLLRQRL
jgi:hypothetical protein